jgi:hypothetical protein
MWNRALKPLPMKPTPRRGEDFELRTAGFEEGRGLRTADLEGKEDYLSVNGQSYA